MSPSMAPAPGSWLGLALMHVLKGNPGRRSRLHTCKGELLDARGFAYLPHCIATTTRLKLTGRRPEVPWLGYRAVRHLEALIQPNWRILELGSGMSTLWFAQRCSFLLSLETDDGWFTKVREHLDRAGLDNVDYRLCPTVEGDVAPDYGTAVSEHRGTEFDLALVDGARRDLAMEVALTMVKPSGYIYLDNTDLPNEECRIAEQRLLHAAEPSSHVRVFTDLSPGVVLVSEGTLAQIGGGRALEQA